MLQLIFGELAGIWRKLLNEKLHNFIHQMLLE